MSMSKTVEETPQDNKTKAGNYFISNYPPYSFWTPDHVPEATAALNRPPRPDTPLGIYLHIPFCRKRCHFCYFRVYTGVNSKQVRTYVEGAIKELELYARQPFIGGRKPTFIYFGGGTPSFLSTQQLTSITEQMKAVLPWDEAEEITFECEPGTLNEQKLKFIKELGVTRLSLGVENYDADILEFNGRAHRAVEIYRAYEWAQACDFPQINIDLIAGMLNETEENWRTCVTKAIDMAPDSVTIYQMEIPYNTTIYQRMKENDEIAAPVADWDTKREWVKYAFSELEANGYTVTSATTAVKDPATKFVYRDKLWEGADLMSLGVASFSHVNGTHFQNEHHMDGYLERLERNELPIYRALTPTSEELMIRELILQFKLGVVRLGYFQEKFGVDITDRFASQLMAMTERGMLETDDTQLRLTRDGLMQVDWLLHDFFLEKHRNQRYA
ncbi:MAG TPA: coproporphyrinogen III oxidase [Lentisphaeria bacterium]|nr:coproporphyrinogen III oxidase [Lentisphaeria bacterium]|tara:strand:+ start:778 stop:2109 length:1332 start_codon:yes stop_codon:yes gene_type:complete